MNFCPSKISTYALHYTVYVLKFVTQSSVMCVIIFCTFYGNFSLPLQIHVLEDGSVQVYSRNSENNTTKYPDIIARMPKVCTTTYIVCAVGMF